MVSASNSGRSCLKDAVDQMSDVFMRQLPRHGVVFGKLSINYLNKWNAYGSMATW